MIWEAGGINLLDLSPRPRRGTAAIARRSELLAAFDNSGLSGAAFARQRACEK